MDQLKQFILKLVDDGETRTGLIFMSIIQVLIVISLISFSISTLPNLDPVMTQHLQSIELVIVLLFTIEYLLRIYAAEKASRFIFSFYGIIDLLAIIPFYITLGVDLRSIRIFRMLKAVRLLKLVRYSKAVSRYRQALSTIREELVLFGVVVLMLLYVSAVGIYYFEQPAQPDKFSSVFHSMWWALTSLTTVGYGDMYPITTGGKVFTFFVLMLGLSTVAVPTGLLSSALSQSRDFDENA